MRLLLVTDVSKQPIGSHLQGSKVSLLPELFCPWRKDR